MALADRLARRNRAAVTIQRVWRGHAVRLVRTKERKAFVLRIQHCSQRPDLTVPFLISGSRSSASAAFKRSAVTFRTFTRCCCKRIARCLGPPLPAATPAGAHTVEGLGRCHLSISANSSTLSHWPYTCHARKPVAATQIRLPYSPLPARRSSLFQVTGLQDAVTRLTGQGAWGATASGATARAPPSTLRAPVPTQSGRSAAAGLSAGWSGSTAAAAAPAFTWATAATSSTGSAMGNSFSAAGDPEGDGDGLSVRASAVSVGSALSLSALTSAVHPAHDSGGYASGYGDAGGAGSSAGGRRDARSGMRDAGSGVPGHVAGAAGQLSRDVHHL